MSGPPLTYNPGTVTGPEAQPGDTRDSPPLLDQFTASVRVEADKVDDVALLHRAEAYRDLVETLIESGNYTRDELRNNPTFFGIDLGGDVLDFDKIWQAAQAEGIEGLPATQEEFDRAAYTRNGERALDQELLSRGRGVAATVSQFGGGMVGSLRDPVNAYTTLIPGAGASGSIVRKVLVDGAINAGVEGYQAIGAADNYARLGEEYTFAQGVQDVGLAFAGGAAFRGAIETGSAAVRGARRLDPNFEDKQLAQAFEDLVPQNLRTPEQEAALSILRRTSEIEEVSPFVRTYEGDEVHFARLRVATDALNEGRVATPAEIAGATAEPAPRPAARPVIGGREDIKRAIAGPESGGVDVIDNRMGSSAAGRYQFIEETFVNLYRQEYGVSEAAAQRAWDSNRYDVAVQERLMDRLLDQNAGALERAGLPADAGNLYLAHFAGSRKAVELLEADPSRPVSDFFGATAIRQNPSYLGNVNGRPRTVGEAIATIRSKVGDPAQRSPAPIRDTPELRDPALDAERPTGPLAPVRAGEVGGEIAPLIEPLTDIALNTRRSLNQIDALADELGQPAEVVRAALDELVARGTLTQNSKSGIFMRKAAAPITPANTPRPRTLIEYLAERGGLNDYGGDLQGMGVRLGDRRFGAKIIRNVLGENGQVKVGDGDYGLDSAFQAARDAGYFPEFNGFDEANYADLLDKSALLLEAIQEELDGLPRYSEASWDRLAEHGLKGSTEELYGAFRRGGDALDGKSPVEQLQDDFRRAWEEFGNDPADLDPEFLFRAADIYDRGEAFLPELALAQAVREDYEATLARAIEEGLEAEYGKNYDPWDPEWQQEVERRLRTQLDGNGTGPDGPAGGGSEGQRGSARESGADSAPDARGGPDAEGRTGPTERELDEAAAARPRSDHTNLPPEPDPRFAEPDGEGVRASSESVWHDIEAEAKAGEQADFAAPSPEQKRAALQAKTEGGIRPKGETRAAGEDGGLFDTQDTTGDLFDLSDGKGARSVADIRAELDTEKSGIEAMRSCLK